MRLETAFANLKWTSLPTKVLNSERCAQGRDELTEPNITRRTFIRGTAGIAGATVASSSALASATHALASTEKNTPKDSADCSVNRLEKESQGYKPRFPGPRWHLIYNTYSGVEEFALDELQATMQRYLPYVVEIHHAAEEINADANHIIVGMAGDNPRIADLVQRGILTAPTKPQGYSSICTKSSWNTGKKNHSNRGHRSCRRFAWCD